MGQEHGVKMLGHSVHPMLIVFPLGLLGTAAIFDLLSLVTSYESLTVASFWMIIGGLVGGAAAAVFGLLDWMHIPSGTRAKSVGFLHAGVNATVLTLFLISLLIRPGVDDPPGTAAVVLSVAGLGLSGLGGWLGGELIERLGVSVHDGAHLNAPSSLATSDATGTADKGKD